MNCLIYCPNSYLREYWDYYLRRESNIIFYFYDKNNDIINDIDFSRFIFCQENEYLSFKIKDKNVYKMYAGEKVMLKGDYDAVYFWRDIKRVIDTAYQDKEIPNHFNATNMHKVMPILFDALKKRTKGLHQLVDPDLYLSEQIINFYNLENVKLFESKVLKSTQEINTNISFKKGNIINIYMPTYYRFEKTKKSIESILEHIKDSKYDIKLYIGDNNTKIKDMNDWLKGLENVYFSEENIGKANMINKLHSQARKCDYIFNIDSDMIAENDFIQPMIDCLELCDNVGLVSSNQKECNQHWFERGVNKSEERGIKIGYAPDCVGVAGGCIVMRSQDWDEIGGYKENHDIYTGDDGILTYNVGRKLGKRVLIAIDCYLIHPKPTEEEKGYTEWKAKSWNRDQLNFIKDHYQGENKKGYYD